MSNQTQSLNKIVSVHPDAMPAFKAIEKCHPLIKTSESFSPQSLLSQLYAKPLLVNKSKDGSFLLVSGFREWLLARTLLPPATLVNCRVMQSKKHSIAELAWSDVYLMPLIFSFHPKRCAFQIGELANLLPEDLKRNNFNNIANINQLSRATNLSRGAFHVLKNNTKSTFTDFLEGL